MLAARVRRPPLLAAMVAALAVAGGTLSSPTAASAVELTKSRARAEINPIFRQELAWADGRAVSAGLSRCRRRNSRIVDCRSVATLVDGSDRRRCTKIYRARRTSDGDVVVSQSRSGSDFRTYVRSRCRSV